MGLAVAKALAERGGWNVHLLDVNEERGIQASMSFLIPASTKRT